MIWFIFPIARWSGRLGEMSDVEEYIWLGAGYLLLGLILWGAFEYELDVWRLVLANALLGTSFVYVFVLDWMSPFPARRR
ncbi:MAG TPA: hypothetical protein VD967_00945 [Candidatus Paceibacterota bacterium]|nr:hypothetical protein [Candidatus Paceibacterota bacterium]